MDAWAIEIVILLNVAMAGVDAGVLRHIRRNRSAASWWKAGMGGAGGSLALVVLFGMAPTLLSGRSGVHLNSFFVVQLVSWVLFVHAPVCLLTAAFLLRKNTRKTAALSALGAIGLLGVAVDAFLIEPTWLEVTHIEIASDKIDRPFRVVVVADLQTDRAGRYERRVFETLRDQEADLILFAGDYIQTSCERALPTARAMNQLMKQVGVQAPEGVFAIQGNVDLWRPWLEVFRGLDVSPLQSTQSFDVGPLRLTCLSVADSFRPRLVVERIDPDRFHLVLGHGPNYAMGRIDADLLLAGHTHGGQVQLPLVGPLTTGCAVPPAWAAGMTELPDGGKLYVSRGVGMERGNAPRIRFLCRPELVVIDLVPQ
ncbi:MAG: hypothetical protein GX621_04305 [Pirellulaceae bacterium]|nr:hypothetical protein [Pirellulaceae bacterium]